MQVSPAEQVFYYHTDPAGTPLAMTDSSGNVVWKADYKPFGEEQSVTATVPNDKRFIGKEKDEETGFSYFGARYQNAKIGRFISPDPVRAVDPRTSKTNEGMLLNPQRLNTYAYALNNPSRYIDPKGLWGEDVHHDMTLIWARNSGFSPHDAGVIAYSDNATDGGNFIGTGGTGWWPNWAGGDQSRHFNTNKSGPDSRDVWAGKEFNLAVSLYKSGDTDAALTALGRGLHSLQDKFAHRDWNTGPYGWDPHPREYDQVSSQINRKENALRNTAKATRDYMLKFKNAVGYR